MWKPINHKDYEDSNGDVEELVAAYLAGNIIDYKFPFHGHLRLRLGNVNKFPFLSLLLPQSFVSSALESDGIPDNHIRMRAQMPICLQESSAHDLLNQCSGPC